MSPVDILVHIAAPTTNQDDNRFTAQALAYGDFKAIKRVQITEAKAGSTKVLQGNNLETPIAPRPPKPVERTASDLVAKTAPQRSLAKISASDLSSTDPIDSPTYLANATIPPPMSSTQQMFDTQFAAAGISSQLSDVSSEDDLDDFVIPSAEVWQSTKRHRVEDEDDDGIGLFQVSKRSRRSYHSSPKQKSATSSFASRSIHTSSQDRRDSLSAEARSPVQAVENIAAVVNDATEAKAPQTPAMKARPPSQSTRMEQEIQAYKLLRSTRPEIFKNANMSLDDVDELVSSLLPDSYGLSKSDSNPTRVHSEIAILGRSQVDGTYDEDPFATCLDENIPTLPARVRCDKAQEKDEQQILPTTEKPPSPKKFNVHRDELVDTISSSPPTPNGHSIKQAFQMATRRTSSTTDVRDFATVAPRSTERPKVRNPLSSVGHRQLSSSAPKRSKSRSFTKKPTNPAFKPPRPKLKPQTVLDINEDNLDEVTKSLREFPRHIFGQLKPCSDGERRPGSPSQSQNSPMDWAMAAERHMLYRRQMHRPLDPIERGCWTFYIRTWTREARLEFLRALQTHMENGAFGEGSWADVASEGPLRLPHRVEVYSGVAELGEAWLLLMVLSDRRVGDEDLHWVGWDGKPAVTMPAKAVRSTAVTV